MPDDASIAGFTIDILANTNINLRLLRSTYFFYYYTMNKIISTLLLCLMVCVFADAKVYTWKGGTGDNGTKWDVASNWTVGTGNTSDGTYPDGTDDDVIIPANEYKNGAWNIPNYPVLTGAAVCGKIYFELYLMDGIATTNSARIGRQDLLTYSQAFCDITIRANRYVRITSPLQNTYTGDFFVEHQTLNKDAWAGTDESHFVPATYEAKVGNAFEAPTYDEDSVMTNPGVVNRAIRGTYYSFYSSNYDIVNQYNGHDVQTPISQWGNPVNGLVTPIKQAVSFDVWVNNGAKKSSSTQAEKDGEVTFHFPAGNTEYAYYDTDGNLSLRQPDRNINRAKSGKFWLDKATMSVPFTQEAPSSMFAVGNPGFAYLSISEFLARNTKNISPFVYTHTEKLNERGSEIIYYYNIADSKLYRIKENYTKAHPGDDDANPGIGDNPLTKDDTHPVAATSREGYLNPAEGFRVMGGSVGFSCDEPGLVGVYRNTTTTTTSFKIAQEVREQYYTIGADGTGTKKYTSPNQEISMLKDAEIGFDMAITTASKSDEIRLNNFLNRGSVIAKIEKSNTEDGKGKLIIAKGQPIMAVFKGPDSGTWRTKTSNNYPISYADYWDYESGKTGDVSSGNKTVTGYGYTSGFDNGTTSTTTITEASNTKVTATYQDKYRVMKLYGTRAAWRFSGVKSVGYAVSSPSATISFNAKDVINPDEDLCDIELDYEIVNGKVTISMPEGMKMFIASDAARAGEKPAFNTVLLGKASSDKTVKDFLCEAWFAYEGATAEKINVEAPLGETFIFEDGVGEYTTYVRENIGRVKIGTKDMVDYGQYKDHDHLITVKPVLGSYNTVGILGLYPDDSTTMVLGQITKEESVDTVVTPGGAGSKTFNSSDFKKQGAATPGAAGTATKRPISIQTTKMNGNGTNPSYTSFYAGATIRITSNNAPITKVELTGPNSGLTYYARQWTASTGTANRPLMNTTCTWTGSTKDLTLTLSGSDEARLTSIVVSYATTMTTRITKTQKFVMLIPAGQLANVSGSSVNPALDHYFYSHGNAIDMVKPVEMSWGATQTVVATTVLNLETGVETTTETTTSSGNAEWTMEIGSENNDCNETMVSRQMMQPLANQEWYDGLILGELKSINRTTRNYFQLQRSRKTAITGGEETPTITPGSGQAMGLTLNYSYPMFYANIPTAENPELRAPSRAASRVNAPTFITASTDDMASSAMVIVNDIFSEEYTQHEDAPLFDAASGSLIVATLAGTQLVGVNATSLVDMLPLYLSQTATVSFTNVASLGENAAIYDAVEDVTTLLVEGQEYELVVLDGQQAGRYFLVADAEAPSITTSVEEVETYSWKPVAYCPAEGALAVCCAEELSYEVYAVNGMLMGAAQAQSYTFSGLQSGTYIVRAIRGQEMQSLKVIVY